MKYERPLITSLAGVHDEEVLKMDDVAAILGVGTEKAADYCSTGTIPGTFRVGNRLRIQAIDFRKKLESEKLPWNIDIDIYNRLEKLSSGRRPKRNVTDGRLRMSVAQLITRLEKLSKDQEIAVGGSLFNGKPKR